MPVVPATGDRPPPEAVEVAARALAEGAVVGLPTDTVYGLGVDPFRPGAVERLFALKRRPREVHLPVLVADEEQALALAGDVPAPARRLMARLWPGALTLVLPRRAGLAADLGSGTATVGVRCPAHELVRALCRAAGPVGTTSANLHGEEPLTTAAAVLAAFGDGVAVVLDGGPCAGAPSTVVDCTGEEPVLLRAGHLGWDDVLAAAR